MADAASTAQIDSSYIGFGTRLGEDSVEAFSDLIFPLLTTDSGTLFFNPRFSLKDEGANEANIGLGYRRRLADWLVGGANLYFDSRESAHNNRFNQWGAGLELLSEYVDFRANYYDANNSRKLMGSYTETSVQKSSRTSATTTTTTRGEAGSGSSEPYAEGHAIYYDSIGAITTDYRTTYTTRTTTTTISKLFEQFEAGMDGWDSELGFKLPLPGPEVRLFGGYYSYDNPMGEDISGVKGRLEVKTGSWLALDAEVFEDEELNGSNYFVGFRLQVPLSGEFSWQKFKDGLFSGSQRNLDQRMRSEMVMRDVRIQAAESGWQENAGKRQREVSESQSQRVVTRSETVGEAGKTRKIQLASNITFVDGDNGSGEDGSNENPYKTIQGGVDNAGENKTIFVYEAGGTASGKPGPQDGGGSYDEQVVLKEGQTITSEIALGGKVYKTENLPVIKPTAVTVTQTGTRYGLPLTLAPVVTMAKDSTIQRLEIDATAPAFASYHTTGGGHYAHAIFANTEGEQNYHLTVEENTLITSGNYANGILLDADNSTDASLSFSGNTIATSGESAYGIWLYADNSKGASLSFSGNTVSTSGDGAYGIWLDVDNSKNASLSFSGNTITTSGESANGILLYVDNFTDASLSFSGNTVSTSGGYANGIWLSAYNSANANLSFSGNTIATSGDGAYGIGLSAYNSANASLSASGNTITTGGGYAYGIGFDASGSTDASLSASDNTITTSGRGANGIWLAAYNSKNASLSVSDNPIATSGQDADGIWLSANNMTTPALLDFSSNALKIEGQSWGIHINEDTNNHFTPAIISTMENGNTFQLGATATGKVGKTN